MKQLIKNKHIVLKRKLFLLVLNKYMLKKKLKNKIYKKLVSIKKIKVHKNSYFNNPKHLDWVKGRTSYIKRRYFGHLGWRVRRFIKKPLKRKKFKRFKKLNWLFKNSINTVFYKVTKPISTKVIKLRKDLYFGEYKVNNDIKISKYFKLCNYI